MHVLLLALNFECDSPDDDFDGIRSDFCLNVVQVDTARPRFQKQSNTRFRSLVLLTWRVDFDLSPTTSYQFVGLGARVCW